MFPLIIFLKGMLIGLAIAAPVGPVGVLCIKTTLGRGWRAGVATGLGAAVGDAFFGAAAAFGIVLITGFIQTHSVLLRIVGGGFLTVLGGRTLLKTPAEPPAAPAADAGQQKDSKYLLSHFVTTLFLTLTNPATILSFIAVFAVAGITAYDNYLYSFLVVSGVFSGSLLWWLILSSATFHAGKMMVDTTLHRVNYFSGMIILGFGVVALLSVLV